MAEWLRLDPHEFERAGAETRKESDVEITVSISPYDVPEAVRGFFNERLKRFVIEFKYLQRDPLVTETDPDAPGIAVRVGKRSKRLYGIEVDVLSLKARSVSLNVNVVARALDSFARGPASRRPENVDIAKAVINSVGEKLLAASP